MSCSNLSSIAKMLLLSSANRDSAPSCAPVRCPVRGSAQKRFPRGNLGIRRMRTQTCGHPQKKAVSGVCSEQDDKRFRFHLGRPRAEAHVGAKGRASSQRSIDYHSLPRRFQAKIRGDASPSGAVSQPGPGEILPLARSCLYDLDAGRGDFDAEFGGFRAAAAG